MQFVKIDWTANARGSIKCSLEKEILSARQQRDLKAEKRKYVKPEKKRHVVKNSYEDKKESMKEYKKEKYVENRISNIIYQKTIQQENPEVQLAYEKCKYQNKISKIKVQRKSIITNRI